MKILVTGANGFIGRQVVTNLLQRGIEVTALVRSDAKGAALRELGAETAIGDLLHKDRMAQIISGVDRVIHCGAALAPEFTDAQRFETNVNGVRNVCEGALAGGVKRVVIVGSIMVLGTRNLDNATETVEPIDSRDAGSASKVAAESAANEYRRRGLDVVMVRPSLVYGPGDPYNIPYFVDALRDGWFTFVGSRDNVVPIVHVDDVADGIVRAAVELNAEGVYNITDGSRTTAGEFFDCMAENLGLPAPKKTVPFIIPQLKVRFADLIGRRFGYEPRLDPVNLRFLGTSRHFDVSKSRAELGYDPKVGYRDGIADSLRELRNSRAGS
ncbi:NAD-dependent epimerase/dehydratase family protein [Nocardia pseudovaccinii]|uniref:NAD-dependent epimerase/dehydratase family protein n=1 Tax=Nocardia pseudovaccinii TaxID=189540 RepID=UPI003D89EE6C